MANSEYIDVIIKPVNVNVVLKSIHFDSGRLYKEGNRSEELATNRVEGKTIESGKELFVGFCGKNNSMAGSVGSFLLYDAEINLPIIKFSWSSPYWGWNSNSWEVEKQDGFNGYYGYKTVGGNNSGAIGKVKLLLTRL